MAEKPKFENAPGLAIKPLKSAWEARWQARLDKVAKGFRPKSVALWVGLEPTDNERLFVSEQCQWLQTSMLAFGQEVTEVLPFDGTLNGLINCYQTDPDSAYHKLRYRTKADHARLLLRIAKEHGAIEVKDIKGRSLLAWHRGWLGPEGKRIAIAHAMMGQVRTVIRFGKTILGDADCKDLSEIMHEMRFPVSRPRIQWMTADQATAIRRAAHIKGWHSIALAEALQFELMLRQKDVIGEWVPQTEPGLSDVTWGNDKWLRGLKWSEIDGWILRHVTSKRQKELVADLRLAPMVMEEFALLGELPKSGPIVINEHTGQPWSAAEFRRKFRIVARMAGVPDNVKNMDSRSGAITEATDAGAPLEHVRHAATHSDISMTQRYSRGGEQKVEGVMRTRVAHRNKGGTNTGEND